MTTHIAPAPEAGSAHLQNALPASAPRRDGLPPVAHFAVLLGYAVLTFLLTSPIAANLSTQVPGGGDAWQHIWNLWWVKKAIIDLHTNPYHTNLVYYPEGANLYFHTLTLTAGLMGIPLQLAGLNLIATYNIVLLVSFVAGGYGAFLLCRYLTGNSYASFVGGLVFAFSPYHFAHLYGHMNLATLQWLPFYVLALLHALDAPARAPGKDRLRGLVAAAGAGALLALNAYSDWLYAIFLVLLTGIIVGWRILAPSERAAFRGRGVGWVEAGLRLIMIGGIFLLITSPIFFPTLAEARQGYAQQPPRETLVYSSDLVMSFVPSELHPIWGARIAQAVNTWGPYLPIKNPSERVVFLGYTVLALAGFSAWRLRKQQAVRFWAFAALLTWVLSLGPLLQFLGKTQFTAFGVTVPLPYLALYKLPLFSIMRTPARLIVLTTIALAVLVAFSMAHLLGKSSGWWRKPGRVLLGIGLPALILFEFLSVPFPMVPPGWGVPIYARIASEPGDFALLELPLRPFGDYMAYQTVHGKPIIGGYLSRQPPYETEQQVAALRYLVDTTPADDPVKAQVEGGKGVAELRDLGVKYVIIRWWAFTPEQKAQMQAKLAALLARPPDFSYPADQVDAWELK